MYAWPFMCGVAKFIQERDLLHDEARLYATSAGVVPAVLLACDIDVERQGLRAAMASNDEHIIDARLPFGRPSIVRDSLNTFGSILPPTPTSGPRDGCSSRSPGCLVYDVSSCRASKTGEPCSTRWPARWRSRVMAYGWPFARPTTAGAWTADSFRVPLETSAPTGTPFGSASLDRLGGGSRIDCSILPSRSA